MLSGSKINEYSVDELLKRQEGKKRRLSATDFGGLSEGDLSSEEKESEPDRNSFVVEDRLSSLRFARTQKPPTGPTLNSIRTTFASLGISLPLQQALTGMSIKVPTEVQAACIPPLLAGK